jgi:hypothetical protein
MPIYAEDIKSLLDDVQMNESAKIAFLALSREEQLLLILSMEAYIRSKLATIEKKQLDFDDDLKSFRVELRQYRSQRERRERQSSASNEDETIDTTQKIIKILEREKAKQFDAWTWFRDRVLPTIITIITLAILYFVFGGKIPTP